MNDSNYKVLINIIGAVESGSQVYGKQRYNAYEPAYANTPNEHTCTLGAFQAYGAEAKELTQMIFDADKTAFRKLDKSGNVEKMLSKDWVAVRWNPNATDKASLIALISSDIGKKCQDEQIKKRLKQYVARAGSYGIDTIKGQMWSAQIQHLGGVAPLERIVKRCNGKWDSDTWLAALKKDQSDKSSSNQVGDKIFWSRHTKCKEMIEKYAKEETKEVNEVEKVLAIAEAEIGYLEKKSNAYLDDKTKNSGGGNYTKYWRDIYPSYQGSAWCDCFIDWCFYKAFGATRAQELECGGYKEFYTPTSAQCYKNKGRFFSTPKVGDQIFFKNSQRIHHTGLVYKVDKSKVYTIEGNTSGGSGVVANGGGVFKKSYSLKASTIAGYGRPAYKNVTPEPNPTPTPTPSPTVNKKKIVMQGQKYLMDYARYNLIIDGDRGGETKKAYIMAAQKGLNKVYGTKLAVDGSCGDKTKAALKKALVKKGANNQMVGVLQLGLMINGYDPNGYDNQFGSGCLAAVKQFQKDNKLIADGEAGYNTFYKLITR